MVTFTKKQPATILDNELQEFLIDRQARNLSPKTLLWYRDSLTLWRDFVVSHGMQATASVDSGAIRRFLLYLAERGHNAGGVANIYGAVKAYFTWYGNEYAPTSWSNPLKKVKSPKRPEEILEPISLDDFKKLVATCTTRALTDCRDKAVLLFLLDSGARRQELTDLMIGDMDIHSGSVLIRKGKGRKARTVFIGAKTKRALLAYLRHRQNLADDSPLWITQAGKKLSYSGIREIIRRRSIKAGIPEPGLHDFRRAFAINCLRAGMDVITLQRLLGHTSLIIIMRYLKQLPDDLRAGHAKSGPVDNML